MMSSPWNLDMILLGDSDISRWPPTLYPATSMVNSSGVTNNGKGGAMMADLLQQTQEWNTSSDGGSCLFLCCAGENDIGSGRAVDQILETFRAVLDALFASPPSNGASEQRQHRMVFLGPKFEPWLTHDNASRKQYAKLNNGFQRAVRKHPASDRISYIDCLTSFCTKETAAAPGAVYGGKAMPDGNYFDNDGLHLNDVGYSLWKQIVEEKIAEMGGACDG